MKERGGKRNKNKDQMQNDGEKTGKLQVHD